MHLHHERHDTAQICMNGHVVNDSAKRYPQFSNPFCKDCGAETITQCSECKAEIQGKYYSPNVLDMCPLPVPAFCHNCGKPYPWTKARLNSAKQLANEEDLLSSEDREALSASLDNLVRDTPETPVAAARFKRLLAKAGKGAAEGFRQVLIDVVSETAKKLIWPNG